MNKFKYRSPYDVYENCYFSVGKYGNFKNKGGIAIEIWNDELGPITRVTTNLDIPLESDEIAIKDYSENTGMLLEMQNLGLVTSVVRFVNSGFVQIPICKYSEEVLRKFS